MTLQDMPLAVVGLVLGLTSMVHCIGMCGGIMASIVAAVPAEIREDRRRLLRYVVASNAGRLVSYGLAGFLAGGAGAGVVRALAQTEGFTLLRLIGAAVLLAIGFSIAGFLPELGNLGRLGGGVWRLIEPWAKRVSPGRSLGHAFAFGCLWGWLPCGMVYWVLFYAVWSGSGIGGLLVMIAFALGTMPALIGTGMAARLFRPAGKPLWLRQVLGIVAVGLAVFSLVGLPEMASSFCDIPQ